VCDPDQTHVARAAEIVEKTRGRNPEVYREFRKLLEHKDVDAVMVATPGSLARTGHDLRLPGGQGCLRREAAGLLDRRGPRDGERGAEGPAHHANGEPHPQRSAHLPPCRGVESAPARSALSTVSTARWWCAQRRSRRARTALRLPSSITRCGSVRRQSGHTIRFACTSAIAISGTIPVAGGRWGVQDHGETPDTMEVLCEFPKLILTRTLHPARV
jgi:hypothetical protein